MTIVNPWEPMTRLVKPDMGFIYQEPSVSFGKLLTPTTYDFGSDILEETVMELERLDRAIKISSGYNFSLGTPDEIVMKCINTIVGHSATFNHQKKDGSLLPEDGHGMFLLYPVVKVFQDLPCSTRDFKVFTDFQRVWPHILFKSVADDDKSTITSFDPTSIKRMQDERDLHPSAHFKHVIPAHSGKIDLVTFFKVTYDDLAKKQDATGKAIPVELTHFMQQEDFDAMISHATVPKNGRGLLFDYYRGLADKYKDELTSFGGNDEIVDVIESLKKSILPKINTIKGSRTPVTVLDKVLLFHQYQHSERFFSRLFLPILQKFDRDISELQRLKQQLEEELLQ